MVRLPSKMLIILEIPLSSITHTYTESWISLEINRMIPIAEYGIQ